MKDVAVLRRSRHDAEEAECSSADDHGLETERPRSKVMVEGDKGLTWIHSISLTDTTTQASPRDSWSRPRGISSFVNKQLGSDSRRRRIFATPKTRNSVLVSRLRILALPYGETAYS